MKFEIDNKTGMLIESEYYNFDPTGKSFTSFENQVLTTCRLERQFEPGTAIENSIERELKPMTLEQIKKIIQAGEKTQEKLEGENKK